MYYIILYVLIQTTPQDMLFILPRLCRQHLRSYVQSHIRQLTTGQPNVCIVGAGPAGFYTAQQILKVYQLKIHDYKSLYI